MSNPQQRPNIMIIMSDQHAGHRLGCAGHRVVSTPAADDLAAAGRRYEAAYCSGPRCVPSRWSFPTGRRIQGERREVPA